MIYHTNPVQWDYSCYTSVCRVSKTHVHRGVLIFLTKIPIYSVASFVRASEGRAMPKVKAEYAVASGSLGSGVTPQVPNLIPDALSV